MSLKESIKQRQIVAFYKEMRTLQGDGKFSQAEYNDAVLKSAIKADMLEGMSNAAAVDDMEPKEVNRLANEVAAYLVDLLKVDPN